MIRVRRIGRKDLEGTAHVESSFLQGSGQGRFPVGDDVCNVALSRLVLLNRKRLKRTPKVRLVLEGTKQGALHRQKGFSLEPGPQSGFGHYQAQEIRTVAWLKSTTIF
jgi:hypothetical protein